MTRREVLARLAAAVPLQARLEPGSLPRDWSRRSRFLNDVIARTQPPLSNDAAAWPEMTDIRTDWLSGRFHGVSEAPGHTLDEQRGYVEALADRGYRFAVLCAASWDPNHRPGTYD